MTYSIQLERGDKNYTELEPLYRQHYGEMQKRLAADGIDVGDYNPRLNQYFAAFSGGWLLNFVARFNHEPVGYANVYITQDMHNSEPIAQEDTLYVLPQHRNGLGRRLVLTALDELRERGIKRVIIQPVTDLRVGKIWKRMGFREASTTMIYDLRS